MNSEYHRKYKGLLILVFCYLLTPPIAWSAYADSENSPEGIGIFVLPDRVTERTDEVVYAEYYKGMSICLNLRLVNLHAKMMKDDARPIKIHPRWPDNVKFRLEDVKTGCEIQCPIRMLDKSGADTDDGIVYLERNEIRGIWVIDGDALSKLGTGEYRLSTSFARQEAAPVLIKILDAQDLESRLRIRIHEAYVLAKKGKYEEAIDGVEAAMKDGGRGARDQETYAILIAAECYEKLGQYAKAFDAYESYLEIWNERNLRGMPEKVIWHMNNLKKYIE